MHALLEKPLLPCPFCGGTAEWEYTPWNEKDETGDDGSGQISCSFCLAEMYGYDRGTTENLWNTRYEVPPARPKLGDPT